MNLHRFYCACLPSDADDSVVLQQAQAVESLTSDGAALSTSDQAAAVSLISTIAATGATTGVTAEGFKSVGKTMDTLLRTAAGDDPTQSAKITDAITSLVEASWVKLEPGEEGMSISTSSVNMTNTVVYAINLQNQTFSPPGTNNTVKMKDGGASSFFDVDDTDSVATSVVSMKNTRANEQEPQKDGKNATSPLLRFSITKTTGGKSGRRRRVLLPNLDQALTTVLQHTKPMNFLVSPPQEAQWQAHIGRSTSCPPPSYTNLRHFLLLYSFHCMFCLYFPTVG